MLRTLALAISLLVAPSLGSIAKADAPVTATAPATWPLPADAAKPQLTKGGGGKITTYNVPRGRADVVAEARKALEAGKWKIVKDEPSPSGNAIRIQASHAGKVWRASYTGDEKATVIIVTAP